MGGVNRSPGATPVDLFRSPKNKRTLLLNLVLYFEHKMWITLEQLSYLKAVSSYGSITAASEGLGKAKSALHYALKKLEDQVGFVLLDTSHYRGRLTPKAEQFLVKAAELLKHYEELKEDVHRIASGMETRLALSATAIFPLRKLNQAILKIQSDFPNTQVVFHRELLSGDKLIQKNVVDIAITEKEPSKEYFTSQRIGEVVMHLVIASHHEFLQQPKKSQTLEKLLRFPQVVQRATINNEESHGIIEDSKQWTVSDLSSKQQIIGDGLGWGRLPFHEIEAGLKKGQLSCLEHISKPSRVSIHIARPKGKQLGTVGQHLWEMMSIPQ